MKMVILVCDIAQEYYSFNLPTFVKKTHNLEEQLDHCPEGNNRGRNGNNEDVSTHLLITRSLT